MEIVIHRLIGETYRALNVAPDWSPNKKVMHNEMRKELERRDTWQGKFHGGFSSLSAIEGVSL